MAYNGMFVPPETDPRNSQESAVGELATYREYLDMFRATLRLKCEGLDPEQMQRRAVPPSELSLLGMVQHMARVEHHWFQRCLLEHREQPRLFDDGTGGFTDLGPVEVAWASLEAQVRLADEVLDGLDDDVLGDHRQLPGSSSHPPTDPPATTSIRDVLVHMIEEYARHMGHVDLLREVIDGRTGL